jgi:hypothetical protein
MKIWKFFRSICPGLGDAIKHMEGRLLAMGAENDSLTRRVKQLSARRTAPMADERITEVLSTAAENPVWLAVLDLTDRQASIETDLALTANITPEARIFNAGRAAAIRDFESYLVQCQANAETALRS